MKSVVINASGGGTDLGSQGNGLVEKEVTLEISNIIKNILESKGVDVYMLRDGDNTISYDERIANLKKKYPNGKNVVLLSNALSSGGGNGIDIIYSLNNKDTLASKIANNIDYFNDTNYYQLRYPNNTSQDYYYITRNTPGYETIIVKYGYVDNVSDANIIKDNIEELASAVADAILDYIGALVLDYYEVQKGDTLYGIASKFSTTVEAIKSLNNLTSNSLSIGQKVKIPEYVEEEPSTSTEANYYVVQKGDTLYGIASKYNTTVDNIKKLNNLTSNVLSIGQKLKISESVEIPSTTENIYVVQKGDSLYSISKKFNTTVEKLKEINNLTSNLLSIGQKLIISGVTSDNDIYIVQKGDTLYGIANKYNTTVDAIKSLNSLTSNVLSIGQKLKINGGNISTYVVQKGDTLYGIANKYNTTVNKLKEINNLTSDSLSIGQTLYIP